MDGFQYVTEIILTLFPQAFTIAFTKAFKIVFPNLVFDECISENLAAVLGSL